MRVGKVEWEKVSMKEREKEGGNGAEKGRDRERKWFGRKKRNNVKKQNWVLRKETKRKKKLEREGKMCKKEAHVGCCECKWEVLLWWWWWWCCERQKTHLTHLHRAFQTNTGTFTSMRGGREWERGRGRERKGEIWQQTTRRVRNNKPVNFNVCFSFSVTYCFLFSPSPSRFLSSRKRSFDSYVFSFEFISRVMEKKGGKRLAPTGGAQKPPVTTMPPSAPEGAAPEGAAAPAEKPATNTRSVSTCGALRAR